MKVLFFENGDKVLVRDPSKDFHCKQGMIKKEDLKFGEGETNKGKKFVALDASFVDKHQSMKRGAQIMLLKEIGNIIVECGLNKDSVVIDAGAGSGFCSLYLANIVKKVHTYEKDERNIKIVQENIKSLGAKNIDLMQRDVLQDGFTKKNVDCIVLDLSSPQDALDHAKESLKEGGYLVFYTPHITQAQDVVNSSKDFVHLKTTELIQREWVVDGKKARPEFQGLMHTGFLTFLRKR